MGVLPVNAMDLFTDLLELRLRGFPNTAMLIVEHADQGKFDKAKLYLDCLTPGMTLAEAMAQAWKLLQENGALFDVMGVEAVGMAEELGTKAFRLILSAETNTGGDKDVGIKH